MELSADKLGLSSGETMTVVNLKCDPLLIGSLREERGFFPAYHMNKEHWITVCLADVPDDKLRFLLDLSWSLSARRRGSSL